MTPGLVIAKALWDGGLKYVVMVAAVAGSFAVARAYYFKQGFDAGQAAQTAQYQEAMANARIEQANRVREVLEEDSRLRTALEAQEDDNIALGIEIARLARQMAQKALEKAAPKEEAGQCVIIEPPMFDKEMTDAFRRLR